MYSEAELQSAVAAGALSHEAAEALRLHVSGMRTAPSVDEEHFRLITGFNDIFVTIAAVLLIAAVASIGQAITPGLGGALVAATAWGMAEYFTRQRRMALPSIVLLLAFAGGLAAAPIEIMNENFGHISESSASLFVAGVGLFVAAGAWLHWRRFMVPITVAAGAAAIAATLIALIAAALIPQDGSDAERILLPIIFIAGLGVFAVAMRWDMSDRARETRRSDVAFWLHLLAAPMICHPLFYWIGVTGGENIAPASAIAVVAIYIVLGLVALAIDRRAMLVSALVYVLVALTYLFREFGVLELNVAITGLVIGSALLTLSAFWSPIRRSIVNQLPGDLRERLPLTGMALA
ncbi:hypothetical protein [Novosphingobium sp. TH158]|uniref:hypothetical protein n=1 Tax=Novosphingobium sp. TH158 TaxID=2067455 RepID=UPI000C7982F8|nr:hypothetical protein [Novosphingobium sp. TH158]PLK26071.1 hypothetical protein C0V78_03620 [Novosphingobium sp. TH158]